MAWFTGLWPVALGGALGSLARLWLATNYNIAQGFPWGTLLANVLGAMAAWVRPGSAAWLLLSVGFCGGFTTFSALCLETLTLLRTGRPAMAGAYLGLSLGLGLLAAALGGWMAGRWPR